MSRRMLAERYSRADHKNLLQPVIHISPTRVNILVQFKDIPNTVQDRHRCTVNRTSAIHPWVKVPPPYLLPTPIMCIIKACMGHPVPHRLEWQRLSLILDQVIKFRIITTTTQATWVEDPQLVPPINTSLTSRLTANSSMLCHRVAMGP